MENKMFCFQCQETAKGVACTIKGVCGKEASTSNYMDLLLGVVRGVSTIEHILRQNNVQSVEGVDSFVIDSLFSTITNANFDDASILRRVDKGVALKKQLLAIAAQNIFSGEKPIFYINTDKEEIIFISKENEVFTSHIKNHFAFLSCHFCCN